MTWDRAGAMGTRKGGNAVGTLEDQATNNIIFGCNLYLDVLYTLASDALEKSEIPTPDCS